MYVDHMDAADALKQLLDATPRPQLLSGFPEVDGYTGGLNEGELIAFASGSRGIRERVLHYLMWAIGVEQNRRVLYVSPTERPTDVVRALISSQISRIDHRRHRNPTAYLHQRIEAAALRLATINSGRAFTQARCLEDICREFRPNVILLNDLQGCIREIGDTNLYTEVTLLLRAMKTMARRYRATCIFTSQLNRNRFRRELPSDELQDLRDSGGIEDDSDMVIFLTEPSGAGCSIEANILKFRNGPTGRLQIRLP